jgi:hypothetical protein
MCRLCRIGKASFGHFVFSLLSFIGLAASAFLQGCLDQSPPTDQVLISEFAAKRSEYERLRHLLEIDEGLKEVATWGFRTFQSPLVLHPPTSELSVARYNEYLAILRLVKASAASRSEGPHAKICISVWASGWAADTRHVAICWLPGGRPNNGTTNAIVPLGTDSDLPTNRGGWYLLKD